ncbi:MAG TPA: carboxypeptidase-like regulatory domain-containing protein, partial [Pyrinomonadaceae bacterium]|nr:carboxypeptidase-like regulatory domain-containing protein [Pyrinomonadaceae bacterium]
MPRTPEVCSSAFCPQYQVINDRVPALTSFRQIFFMRFAVTAMVLLLLFAFSNRAYGQGSTATLSGTVTDQNDAVVPGVNVAVISITQGFQRSTSTNGEGSFVVPLLPPGTYTVKAEREGFTTAEVRDVVLNVNDQVTINIPLKLGSLSSQSVDVLPTPPLLDQSPMVATTVDREFVSNLPLNGRGFQQLITLSPGVVLTKTSVTDQGQFSVNGQRANANYVTVDGVSANIGIIPAGNIGQSSTGALPGFSVSGGT